MKMEPIKIIDKEQVKPTMPIFRVRGIFNPAGVRLEDGKILLFARVAETPYHDEITFLAPIFCGKKKMKMKIEKIPRKDMELEKDIFKMKHELIRLPTISHFRKLILDKDGEDIIYISEKPDFYGIIEDGDFGVEDPRITYFEEDKTYAMTYVAVSKSSGVSTCLALSKDLNNWDRKGIIFRQQNKDVAIFPEKINGYYLALNRPEGNMIFDRPSLWISYSKDLIFWGKDKPIMHPRELCWDGLRIGTGTVPIKTEEGWLEIYHGVQLSNIEDPESPKIYRAGAVLFDLNNPEKIIARSPEDEPLFEPEKDFEKIGFVNNVVFPTAVIRAKGDRLLVYSGGADSCITLRRISIKEILNHLNFE